MFGRPDLVRVQVVKVHCGGGDDNEDEVDEHGEQHARDARVAAVREVPVQLERCTRPSVRAHTQARRHADKKRRTVRSNPGPLRDFGGPSTRTMHGAPWVCVHRTRR